MNTVVELMKNNSTYFVNKECEYYPCHKTYSELNCMFCFCPLYNQPDCGGTYKILTNGIKDCSDCLYPHRENSYQYIIAKLRSLNGM